MVTCVETAGIPDSFNKNLMMHCRHIFSCSPQAVQTYRADLTV